MRLLFVRTMPPRTPRNCKGVTAAEYAVLGAAVVFLAATAVTVLGDPVNGAFSRLANVITDTVNELVSTGAGLGAGQGSAQGGPTDGGGVPVAELSATGFGPFPARPA